MGLISGLPQMSAAQSNRPQIESLREGMPEIIGGKTADPSEYPYAVSLRYAPDAEGVEGASGVDRHFCGGSIVGSRWVLTAAHCAVHMYGAPGDYTVGAHGVDLNQLEEYPIDGIWLHPQYDAYTFDYDFALLRLARETDGAIVMSDAASTGRVPVGETATVVGWGIGDDGLIQRYLREVDVEVVSLEDCNDADSYQGLITERMICLGVPDAGGRDSCQGDSGGGAIATDTFTGRPMLFGTVSWGEGCAEPEYYGVYGDVASVTDWIDVVVGQDRANAIIGGGDSGGNATEDGINAIIE